MGSAYLRYLVAFLAGFVSLSWFEILVRTDELPNFSELALGWFLLAGGWAWLLALLTAAPLILLMLARGPESGVMGRGRMVRGVVWGLVLPVLGLAFWGALILGAPISILWQLWYAPIAYAISAAIAGAVIARSKHVPSARRVGVVLGCLSAISLIHRVLVPAVAPAFAYEHFDNSIANPIAVRTLMDTQAGDSAAVLNRRLPGFVPAGALEGKASWQSGLLGAGFHYRIAYRDGVVDSISAGGRLSGD